MRLKKVIKKLMCGIMVTVLAMSSMSVTKTEATEKKEWHVYYRSEGAYSKSCTRRMTYQHTRSHYAVITSITGAGKNKYATVRGVNIRLYDVPKGKYVEYYTLKETVKSVLFRPYPVNGEPSNSTFLIDSGADLNGAYIIDGYIEWK